MLPDDTIPYGFCQCGCGQRTNTAKQSQTRRGHINGQPMPFLHGHCRPENRPVRVPTPLSQSFARFWSYVEKTDGCWLWTGCANRAGYGMIRIGGRKGRTILAHRISYELTYGPIPEGLLICHTCDNPSCVRPDHLFSGTKSDNALDMWRKGRHANRPYINGQSKLTVAEVIGMRTEYDRNPMTFAAIARLYGVSENTVHNVILRKAWVRFPNPLPVI